MGRWWDTRKSLITANHDKQGLTGTHGSSDLIQAYMPLVRSEDPCVPVIIPFLYVPTGKVSHMTVIEGQADGAPSIIPHWEQYCDDVSPTSLTCDHEGSLDHPETVKVLQAAMNPKAKEEVKEAVRPGV